MWLGVFGCPGVKGWTVLFKRYAPLGCAKNRLLAALLSVQCAAALLMLQGGVKKQNKKTTFGIAIHFSIFWEWKRLVHPNVFLFIRRHCSPSTLIEKSMQ